MKDILDLPDWTVLDRATDGDFDVLDVEYTLQPDTCQKCGAIGQLYRHGTKQVTYLDTPRRDAPARLRAKVQRYRCRACNETFLQPLGGVQPGRQMTQRCATYIQSRCLRDTFVHIAAGVGCDDKTVRNLATEHIARLEGDYRPALPAWLGVDETRMDGEMRTVLTDICEKRMVDLLTTRDKDELTNWLNQFRDRSHVHGVVIDMWRPYRTTVHHLLPGVPVVVDKSRVVATASQCMERVFVRLQRAKRPVERREWQRSKAALNMRKATLGAKARVHLDMLLNNEPVLAEAYRLKEAFCDLYDLPKAQAVAAFDTFPSTVPATVKTDFKPLLTCMSTWRTEILAFFDHPITNVYADALNGVAKTINRLGRGYSFDVLRARLLFGERT